MQQPQAAICLGDIIHNRYMVENILGAGGSSTVYLVRDLHIEKQTGTEKIELFALKELRDQKQQDRQSFLFEGEILKRLNHKALPRIHHIFQDDARAQVFILMDYIEGPNLETLRRQQTDQSFTLSSMLTMMEPIVDAVAYLHLQQPPVIHRDIKPANIIIPKNGERAFLVDFGIAKEYDVDATTTAIRRLSPGYGAPEQYSQVGTDTRTDIYGLAATCYALLTGRIPADAFQRMTTLVSKMTDPLLPVNVLAPKISLPVAKTITRGMSIKQEARFATVGEFWQDMRIAATIPRQAPVRLPITAQLARYKQRAKPAPAFSRKKSIYVALAVKRTIIALLVALLLVGGIGLGFKAYTLNVHSSGIQTSKQAVTKIIPSVRPTLDTSAKGITTPQIAKSYNGTIYDMSTNLNTNLTLLNIQQNNERISGSFVGLSQTGTFTGVLDASQHIFLTVAGTAQHPPYFFQGTVRQDSNLVGNYCDLDQAGQCTGGYGLWSVSPALP